jgi:diketogulonate reductase-like aldo/keto reductase
MSDTDGLRYKRIPLNNGSDEIPALGFGTLIPDPAANKEAVGTSLEVGFRQFDCAERYRMKKKWAKRCGIASQRLAWRAITPSL